MYNNIKSGVDLEYILEGNDIKENIIVKSRQSSYVYDFQLILSGLVATLNDDGSISLSDIDDGTAKYTIPAPYMYDANGEISYSVTYSLLEVKPELYILTVNANDEWINDAERAFPVIVDPTIVNNNVSYDTYIDENNVSYDDSDNLVVSENCTAFIKFNLPELPEEAILHQIQLKLSYYFIENCANRYIELEIRRAPSNFTEDESTDSDDIEPVCTKRINGIDGNNDINDTLVNYSEFFDVTALGRVWYDVENSNEGLKINRANVDGSIEEIHIKSSETTRPAHKPHLYIEYTNALSDGIYMFQNVANSNMYMDVRNNSISAGAYVQQLRYLSRTNPKTEQSASGLFELTYKESTDSYIIRCLTNRELTFGFGETIYGTNPISPLVTKEISLNDSYVLAEDTFRIEYHNGFVIHEYSSPKIVSAQNTISSGEEGGYQSLLTSVTVSMVSDLSRWNIIKCSDDNIGPFASFNITGEVLAGKTATFTPFVSVGGDEYEITNITVSVPDGIATFISESSDGSLTYKFHDEGTIYFNVTVRNGLRSITLDPMAYDVKLPFAEGNYVIKNKAINNYLYDVLLSGNIVTANNFQDAAGAYHPHCWVITHVIDGYYLIKSFEEEGYLTAPELYDIYVASQFYSEELSDRQLWLLDEDVPTIKAKMYEDTNNVIQVAMDSSNSAVYNMSYSSDSDYMDEWVLNKINSIADITLVTQDNTNWCWVACSNMFAQQCINTNDELQNTNINLSQHAIVSRLKGSPENTMGSPTDTRKAIDYYLNLDITDSSYYSILYDSQIFREDVLMSILDEQNIVMAGLRPCNSAEQNYSIDIASEGGHFVIIYGYILVDNTAWFIIADPLAEFNGKHITVKYENVLLLTHYSSGLKRWTDSIIIDTGIVYESGGMLAVFKEVYP